MKFFGYLAEKWRGDEFLRWATLVVGGSALAFIIAGNIWFSSASIAALTAALLVQGTFHESVKEGLLQLAGVFIGVTLGLFTFNLFGHYGAFSLFFATTGGFIFARITHLKIASAVSMIAPIIVVVGSQNITTFTVEQRLSGILIGGVIALLASYTTRSGNPAGRIAENVSNISARTSSLLLKVSAALSDPKFSSPKAQELVDEAEKNIELLLEAKKDAEDAIAGAKFSPFLSKEDAVKARKRADVALSIATVVDGMTKTLLESTKGSNKSSTSRPALQGEGAEVVPENIGATAALVAAHLSDTKKVDGAQTATSSATRLDSVTAVEVNESYLSAVEVVKNMDETAPLLLSGSLLASSRHIASILTEDDTGKNIGFAVSAGERDLSTPTSVDGEENQNANGSVDDTPA